MKSGGGLFPVSASAFFLFFTLAAFILLAIFSLMHSVIPAKVALAPTNLATVEIGEARLFLDVADTPLLRARGLSGREAMDENSGMLFIFPSSGPHTFWMKDMLIPIDIVWISGDKVLGVLTAEPAPTGTPDDKLPRFNPPGPVDLVIELRARRASELGIRAGQSVKILLP